MKILKTSLVLPIRFSETDAMGVVWHGNYLKFFEDAREKFGEEFGMEYLDMYRNGFFTPIVKSEINHKATVYYGDKVQVDVKLQYHAAAKIIFHYTVINLSNNQVAAVGSTTQVFMDATSRALELNKPEFYATWEQTQNWIEQ